MNIKRLNNPLQLLHLKSNLFLGTTRNDIIVYSSRRIQSLIEELNNDTFNVAFTSDIWSGQVKEDYRSVVIHYIDDDCILQKRITGFRLVSHILPLLFV